MKTSLTSPYNKRKIINDPVYGFISIPNELIFDLIEHQYFQRLRRIQQLGLTHLVYPGALHTRFHHAIGAMHLMQQAITVLRSKDQEISDEEATGALIAILLHDIGHGPYSHTLENCLVFNMTHEDLSELFMNRLNEEFSGQLTTGIAIFRNTYPKKFLHQLVSSQLDMDRLDYLKRDSFFTGVSEGVISSDRLIKMLNVNNDTLVIEAKGIYSVEKFVTARRLMYWQVYYHKTVLAAEYLLIQILHRAAHLTRHGIHLQASLPLSEFLTHTYNKEDFSNNPDLLNVFAQLDDFDVMGAVKNWCHTSDKLLKHLCCALLNRQLFRVEIESSPIQPHRIQQLIDQAVKHYHLTLEDASYLVFTGEITNSAYNPKKDKIFLLNRDNSVVELAHASQLLNVAILANPVNKYFICYPKALNSIDKSTL